MRLDLAAIRDRVTARTVAERVEDDLRHLAPDLVRWHLPREPAGGLACILPRLPVGLTWYDDEHGHDPEAPALWVHTQAHRERPQRPLLRFGPLDRTEPAVQGERWDGARYLWDDRATDGLRHRLNGWPSGPRDPAGDRTPFFHRVERTSWLDRHDLHEDEPVLLAENVAVCLVHRSIHEAWATAGVTANLRQDDLFPPDVDEQRYAMVASLVAEVRRRLVTGAGSDRFVLRHVPNYEQTIVVTPGPDGLTATLANGHETRDARVLPRVTWQLFPDLEMLHTGRIRPNALHPLVRAALFPDEPEPDEPDPDAYRPRADDPVPGPLRVRCGGTWHRVGWRDGRVDPHDHPPEEVRREGALGALGGDVRRASRSPGPGAAPPPPACPTGCAPCAGPHWP